MKIEGLKAYLIQHQVPEEMYVIQELGAGEAYGIGFLDGAWTTYFSERGGYGNRRSFATEEEAVDAFLVKMREVVREMLGLELP